MARRGRTPRIAALPTGSWGGFIRKSRAEAGAILGEEIPEEVWEEIHAAFDRFAERLAVLEAPRANHNRNDSNSYEIIRQRAIRDLERGRPLRLPTETLHQLAVNAGLAELSTPEGLRLHNQDPDRWRERFHVDRLRATDPDGMRHALDLVRAAEPRPYQPASEAQARAEVTRRLRAILSEADLPTWLSNRWQIDADSEWSELTPFELLVRAIIMPDAQSPRALAEWVYEALR